MRAHTIATKSPFILVLAVVIIAVWAAPASAMNPDGSGKHVVGGGRFADRPPAAPEPPRVLVATTGNQSERVRKIPITRRKGGADRVVMSMKPQEVPDFRTGDRMKVTTEVQFSVNCIFRPPESKRARSHRPGCDGPQYPYNPIINASLVLADGKTTTGGKRALPISGTKRNICRQKLPFREHHCVITFTQAGFTLLEGKRLPCAPGSCRINLVASAHNPRAGGRDLLMVGGLHPNGAIPQDRARINAIRFRPADQPPVGALISERPLYTKVPSVPPSRVILSIQLDDVRAGEQLEVSATLKTRIRGLPYNVRHSAQLVLAGSRTAASSDDTVRAAEALRGEIDERNLFNCTRNRPSCVTRKVGIAQIQRDVDGPLFVNLYTIFSPKHHEGRSGDRVKIVRGRLEVVRYPAELRG